MKMPVIFMGHGSPMNAIEENKYTKIWKVIARTIPRPQAIVCISAHWQKEMTSVTALKNPRTIYDFSGFPEELYHVTYPAPGSPVLATQIAKTIKGTVVTSDLHWGLDHGAWSVLVHLFPQADIPVLQLSLNTNLSLKEHFQIGRELAVLRDQGVLILGSGNIVHNLMVFDPSQNVFPWALTFDQYIAHALTTKNTSALLSYEKEHSAKLAVPTNEHYLPLLYVVGATEKEEPQFFCEDFFGGSISMRCVGFGLTKI